MTDENEVSLTEDLVTLDKAAQLIGVSSSTIRKLIKRGSIKALQPTRKYLIRVSELQRFIDSLPNAVDNANDC